MWMTSSFGPHGATETEAAKSAANAIYTATRLFTAAKCSISDKTTLLANTAAAGK